LRFERLLELAPLGVSERGIARLADRLDARAVVLYRAALDQGVEDAQEIPLAALVGLAVALDQPAAQRNFQREARAAPGGLGDARARAGDALAMQATVHGLQRLFGAEAGVSKAIVAGVSHFLPGGGAGPDASPPEKVYYVLEGELTVIVGGKETVLKKNDSCFIGPNESREIVNRTNEVCTIFVAVAAPPA